MSRTEWQCVEQSTWIRFVAGRYQNSAATAEHIKVIKKRWLLLSSVEDGALKVASTRSLFGFELLKYQPGRCRDLGGRHRRNAVHVDGLLAKE